MRDLQQEIDAHEFAEWMAFDRICPFGDERADLRAGIIASTIANCAAFGKKRTFKPSDFMPEFDRKPKTLDELEARFKLFVGLHNENVRRKVKNTAPGTNGTEVTA